LIILARRDSTIPYAAASTALANALDTLKQRSTTAKQVIDFVQGDRTEIQILVTNVDGAFGPHNEAYGFTGPCIIWYPGGQFNTRGATIKGYRPNNSPIFDKKMAVTYPPEITLLHELGHAKQFIEGGWFDGSKDVKDIEADNLRRHENPVCKEYGLLQRVKYDDFIGFEHLEVNIQRAPGR
jgi:hypothetical protein